MAQTPIDNIALEVLTRAIKQEKNSKGYNLDKKKMSYLCLQMVRFIIKKTQKIAKKTIGR